MPDTITLAQHIFASLTREQSPTRRRGYQTLFYTRDRLNTADIRAIEDRAQYRAIQGDKDKWQLFWLPSRQAVITRFVPVPEPDEFGRKGRYLAHSLILSAADWHSLNYTPFGLMKAASFCRTMDQALALGDLKTGELSAIPLEIARARHERARELASQWSPDELWKLARLTCHAYAIIEGRQFVAFVGDDLQINEALDVAFLLPPPPRSACSFDTSAKGCVWPRDVTFWGQGFANEREARTPFIVDAANRKVQLPTDWHPRHTPYERWLNFMVNTKQFSSLQKGQRDAHLLSEVLEGHPVGPDKMHGVTVSVKTEFAEANQAQIEERIASLFPKQLPDYLRDTVLNKIGRTLLARLDWLVKNPAGEAVGEILFEILGEWRETPSPELLRSISPLAIKHSGLRLLFALWADDEKEIQHSLSLMTAEQYQQYVSKLRARSSCQPWHFFSAKHLHAWFTLFDQRFQLSDIALGIALVARHGSHQELDDLSAIPARLNTFEERKALLEWLEEESLHRRVKSLKSALEQSLRKKSESASDAPASLRGWFTRRFERR